MPKRQPNTISYLRVSTDRQDLDNQRAEIGAFAEREGLTVDREIAVETSSRRSEEERKIDELIQGLRKGDTLVVSSLSRLGRSVKDISALIPRIAKERKANLLTVQEGLRLKGGNGDMDVASQVMVTVFALVSELERTLISQRTKAALQRLKAEGRQLGNPRLNEFNKGLTEKADAWAEEKRTLFESFVARGLTQRQIAAELNKAGIRARRGGEWSLAQVQFTLKRLGLVTQRARGAAR